MKHDLMRLRELYKQCNISDGHSHKLLQVENGKYNELSGLTMLCMMHTFTIVSVLITKMPLMWK